MSEAIWTGAAMRQLLSALSMLEDPRDRRGRLHTLSDVLAIVVLAVLCGCDNAEELEEWGCKQETWLRRFLSLPHGIASQDTYLRVLAALDPDAFGAMFLDWVRHVFAPLGLGRQLAIDAKSVRGSRSANAEAVHMVSALLCESGLVMAQVKTEAKSNEIVAIPQVLKLLSLPGTLVSIDAMGCQRAIAQQIVEQGGDDLLQVKGNQPALSSELEATRQDATTGAGSKERRYYISSRALDAEQAAHAVRAHWLIENQLHWVLDMTFGEDACTVRTQHAAHNLAVIRHFAFNLLRRGTDKPSLRMRQRRCDWDPDYREQLLRGAF